MSDKQMMNQSQAQDAIKLSFQPAQQARPLLVAPADRRRRISDINAQRQNIQPLIPRESVKALDACQIGIHGNYSDPPPCCQNRVLASIAAQIRQVLDILTRYDVFDKLKLLSIHFT